MGKKDLPGTKVRLQRDFCRKSTLGVTKYLKKVSYRQVTWLKKFQKNCHTEKSAVVLPTILLKDKL